MTSRCVTGARDNLPVPPLVAAEMWVPLVAAEMWGGTIQGETMDSADDRYMAVNNILVLVANTNPQHRGVER